MDEEEKLKQEFPFSNSVTKIPIEINFDSELHDFIQEAPPINLPQKSKERPGFFETLGGKFIEQEEFIQLAKDQRRRVQDDSPLDDYVDPNWSPHDDKSVQIGVDPRNMGYILGATGPKDQRRRYNYVMEHQEHDERISNGSFLAQLTGGGAGFIFSPSSLIPIAQVSKYAKVSQTLLQTLPKMVGGIGLSSAAHEAVLETNKIGGNLYDWAIDTLIDTVLGTAFMGAHISFKYANDASKLFNARKVLKLMNNGIDARPVIDEKGIIQGFKATPTDGSVGAAEVDLAQVYLDAALSKSFLYSIPYIGDFVGKGLGKTGSFLAGAISPKVRMFNSQFSTIRGFANHYVEHAFDTLGIEKGRANETPFETFMSILKGTNTTLKTQYDGLYLKYNGIDYHPDKAFDRTKANLKAQQDKYFKDGFKTKEQFGRDVQNVLITEKPSENAAVNEAALLLREAMDPLYLEYLKLNGISDKILVPRTTKGFLSRVYWVARMEVEEDRWMTEVPQKLAEDDAIITNLLEPVQIARNNFKLAEEEHLQLQNKEGVTPEQIKESFNNLRDLERAKKAAENRMQDELRENADLHRHIEDINAVSAKEAAQIKKIIKPLEKIEKELNAQKKIVADLQAKQFFQKKKSLKAKDKEEIKKQNALKAEHENQLKLEQQKLKELQDAFDQETEILQEKMHNKEIPEELYYRIPDSNRYKLKDHTNRLKPRKVYESDFARKTQAKAYYDTILNQTAEDNIANILNKATGKNKEDPLVQRTIMFDDEWLYKNNWLHPDPSINVMNYRNYVGRQNAIKKILNRLTVNGTFDELIQRLADEHATMKNNLFEPLEKIKNQINKLQEEENPNENEIALLKEKENKLRKKYEKNVKSLGKSYKKAKEDLRLSILDMRNKSEYPVKGRQLSKMANLYAVITKLGFLAATMSTDLMATVFKFGLWPSVRDGLLPMLKNLGGMLNTSEGQAIRENAAHAHVAMNHLNTAYSDKNFTGTSQTYEPVQGKLTTGLETLAHYSNNFSLANYVENFNQRLAAQIIQSKIMKAMLDFKDGKISKQDMKDLLRYGIDPKLHADSFIQGWENAGKEGNGFGGYQSYYWRWENQEASNLMSQAILRAVKDTIIRRGPLDAPFAMNNPIFNSIFLFKGYVLASMTRYLAPLMQSPNGRKIVGTMLMLAAGSTQNPLRRLAAGQDPVQEEDHMFRNAIRDGGVFSILGDAYEEMNFVTHGFLEETVNNERYRGRTEMGVFNGPVGGMINDGTRILGMIASGQWNQTDLKRAATNTPFLYSWQLRYLVNQAIKDTGLPKTRAEAKKRART